MNRHAPKPLNGVIGIHFKSKELYPWPNHSSNISIKKVIGNDIERLKNESKWVNLHVFCHFCSYNDLKCTKNMWICSFWLNFETFHIIPDNFSDRNIWGVVGSRVKLLGFKVCTNDPFHWFLVHGLTSRNALLTACATIVCLYTGFRMELYIRDLV